jgi:hypothetical protein
MACLVVRHRRRAFAAWALFALMVLPHAAGIEQRLETGSRVPGSESARVAELMATRFSSPYARYSVLVIEGMEDPAGEAGREALRLIVAALSTHEAVAGSFSLLDTPDDLFVGSNGGTFIVVGLK